MSNQVEMPNQDELGTLAEVKRLKEELEQLYQQLEARDREFAEAQEQQTATSEILRVIASSPTDIQPVLDVVAENAARLCDATDAVIHRFDGNDLQMVAHYGPIPSSVALGGKLISGRGVVHGRAITDRQTIHVHDIAAETETEFPDAKDLQGSAGTRTILATPLLCEGVPIGVIVIRRTEVRPFSEKHISLLKTLADQAVIAIENVRLFQESQNRNRELAALHDVTAAASQSLEISPVLQEGIGPWGDDFSGRGWRHLFRDPN